MGQPSQACTVVTLALSVLLAGCNISLQGPAGAATPEDAARQAHAQGSGRGAFQNFMVVGTRVSGNRGVVFSTGIANSSQQITPSQMFGVDVLTKEAGGWFSRSSSSGNVTFQTISPALVCGNIDTGNDQLGYYTLIYGSVRSPDVVSVEV